MLHLPHVLGAPHQRGEDLVIVLAAAQVSRNPMRQLFSCGIGVCLQKAHCGHDEAGHTEGALESLLVDDPLLSWVKCSVSVLQAFDRYYLPAANRMSEHRARIVRDVINKDRAGTTFGAVATQLRAREAQFVSQRPCQCLLLHHIGSPSLGGDVESEEPVSHCAGRTQSRSTEQIARRANRCTTGNDSFDKFAPGYGSLFVCHYSVRVIFHRTEHEANRLPSIRPPIPISCECLRVD